MDSYSSYKDSEVEWIGEVPKNSDIIRLKYLCSVKTGDKDTQDKVEDGDYPFYVRSPNIERINSYSFDGESVLTVGDGVGTGKVFHYVNGKFEFHQRVYKFSDFKRVTGKFFYWFMKHNFIFVTKDQNSKSTVDSLRRPLIDNFQFVVPSNDEQTQIVSFLDTKTQKIDELIEKTEQKIKLLKEKRTSLINHCVTKGLNPNVEMKDSGVEWIGEIPKDWLVSKIMFITNKVTDGSHHSPETEDEGKLYVTVSNVTKSNDIDFNSCSKISEDSFSDLEKNGCKPKKGDVLITKDGTIGRGLVVSDFNDYVILSSIGLIRFQEKVNPYYGLYYLLSGLNIDQMYSHVRGSGITRLTINLIKNLLFILPSETEQTQIVEYLEEQTQKIDSTIEKETQRIELLKEYRQSLISEVVTGKIDVRDWKE